MRHIMRRNSLMNLAFGAGVHSNPQALLQAENRLTANILKNDLMYKVANAQHEALKKRLAQEIERSFSTFI